MRILDMVIWVDSEVRGGGGEGGGGGGEGA